MVTWGDSQYKYLKKGNLNSRGYWEGPKEDMRAEYKLCNKDGGTWKDCINNPPEGTIGWERCRKGRTDLAHNCGKIPTSSKDEHSCAAGYECYALVGKEINCDQEKKYCGADLPKNCPNIEDPFSQPECKKWIEDGIIGKDASIKQTLENYCKRGENINDKSTCSNDLKNNFQSSFLEIASEYCKKGSNILYKAVCNSGFKDNGRLNYDSQLDTFCKANSDKLECACWREPNEEEKKILSSTISGFKKECHRSSCASSDAFKTKNMESSLCPSLQICFQDIGVNGSVGGTSEFSNIIATCNQETNIDNTEISNTDINTSNVENTYDVKNNKKDDEKKDDDDEKKETKKKKKKDKEDDDEEDTRTDLQKFFSNDTNIIITIVVVIILVILLMK